MKIDDISEQVIKDIESNMREIGYCIDYIMAIEPTGFSHIEHMRNQSIQMIKNLRALLYKDESSSNTNPKTNIGE